jgi:16S rRNA (guanine1207-N2)-methyltransferase
VLASDQSAAAVASAAATAAANGVADRVRVTRDDAASTVVTGAADRLFAAAARVLHPGGELWTVYNNQLPHKAALRRLVGPTRVAASDRRFTVTVSTRR